MENDVVLWIVVATALAFDFTNGFHDTANAVATSISTRAMAPRAAVTIAAILNFVGAFLSLEVAATVASGIVESGSVTLTVIFAGLAGAIVGEGLLGKVLVPALIAPTLAFLVAGIAILLAYRVVGRQRPGPVARG